MKSNSREREDFRAKQEGDHQNTENRMEQQLVISSKPNPSSSSSSRQWTSAFRNPRIVRVSRTFGGKDRHSKVCTVRGLRDRRIRLSVPTAIQLYDLQDRLGLSQPSKVIDWLLEAAKDDVDKLPPLQLPQGFGQLYPSLMFGSVNNESFSGNLGFFDNWDIGGGSSRTRSNRDAERENLDLDKGKWIKFDDVHRQHDQNNDRDHGLGIDHLHLSSSGQSSGTGNKFYPILVNNPTIPSMCNSSYYHLDPSNLSLSNFGHLQQSPESSNVTVGNMNLQSATGGSQLFFCPPAATMTSLFPTYPSFLGASHHHESGHLQLLSSNSSQQILSGSSLKPFHQLMNVNPGFSDMQRNNAENRDKDSDS